MDLPIQATVLEVRATTANDVPVVLVRYSADSFKGTDAADDIDGEKFLWLSMEDLNEIAPFQYPGDRLFHTSFFDAHRDASLYLKAI